MRMYFSKLFYILQIPVFPIILLTMGISQPYNKNSQQIRSPVINANSLNGFAPNHVLVKFSADISSEIKRRTIRRAEARALSEISALGVTILQIPDGEVQATIDELIQDPGVIYAEPNYFVEMTDIIPNDPGWNNQYNLSAIRAPAGWELNTGAVWVTIAIVDSGVDLSHPDLFVRVLPGYDFVNNDNDAQDDNGHGTHVAAIAAASSNNAVGISGVNWGANILPVKVLNASGGGSYANVAAGIIWATDQGAQVINLSLGGPSPSFVLNDSINYAYQRGVILVASTGNAGAPAVLYPAAYDPVIAVGATDSTNAWAGFSNYGSEIDIVAPGVNIYSAFPNGGYGFRSGTSMSAPHVSGLAAILWGIPGNGPAGIRTIMESTSLDLGNPGWDEFFGFGLIQMDAAIQQALPVATQTPFPVATQTPSIEVFKESQIYPSLFPIGTFTFTFTSSPLLTITTSTPFTMTAINEGTNINRLESPTPTLPNQELFGAEANSDWWVACFGIGLILIGGLLFWVRARGSRNKYLKKRF